MNNVAQTPARQITIRRAIESDLTSITAIDEKVTKISKPDLWRDNFERYSRRRKDERFFLVAEDSEKPQERAILGYIIGEVRAWEFGSGPCGWVFAFSVDPETRQQRIGEQLFEAISDRFKKAGIKKMRTMVPRKNRLHMAFFRSEGMVAGPYIQLEKDLDD